MDKEHVNPLAPPNYNFNTNIPLSMGPNNHGSDLQWHHPKIINLVGNEH